MPKEQWKTIKGAKVLVGENGEIEAGAGGKFTGKTLKEAFSKKSGTSNSWSNAKTGNDAAKAAELPNKELTTSQKDALENYTAEYYRVYNQALRGDYLDRLRDKWKDEVKELDSLFKDASTKEDIIVNRFIEDESDSFTKKLEIGSEFVDKAFTSTTYGTQEDIKNIGFFGENDPYSVLEIHVPKGTKAIDISDYSYNKDEKEILIDRNTKYRVVDIESKELKSYGTEARKQNKYILEIVR